MPSHRFQRLILWLLIALGVTLWVINWWAARPLFLDEANVARNLFDRGFGELFRPLDHDQYAPPFYLLLTKLCAEVFGYGERALRLPSLLGGGLAIWGLLSAGKSLKLGYWTLLPLVLLFVNPLALRYVGEVKPYALDLGLAAAFFALALREKPLNNWWWAGLGAVAIWCSLPVVFVLAAVGGLAWWRSSGWDRQAWLGNIVVWLSTFGVLYHLLLEPALGITKLADYHAAYFFPLPTGEGYDFRLAGELLRQQLANPFGYTFVAALVGLLAVGAAFLRTSRRPLALLSLPVLLVLFVSTTGKYSLLPRLLLFTFPAWWLLAGLGTKCLAERWSKKRLVTGLLLGAWLLVLGATNVIRHYYSPLRFSDSRAMVTGLKAGYTPVLHRTAVPAYDYYGRIHPETRREDFTPLVSSDIRQQNRPGRYVLVYDVLTTSAAEERIQRDISWARTQDAAEVETQSFLLGRVVYLRLP